MTDLQRKLALIETFLIRVIGGIKCYPWYGLGSCAKLCIFKSVVLRNFAGCIFWGIESNLAHGAETLSG
jgi:hypothetical protein